MGEWVRRIQDEDDDEHVDEDEDEDKYVDEDEDDDGGNDDEDDPSITTLFKFPAMS